MTDDPARDDFSQQTLRALAGRSGYRCAFPSCARLTIGHSEDRKSRVSMVGVGAHITAAAPGGPRFDGTISPEERSSESNGIWMCSTHGKLVDNNASKHSAEDLRRWKSQHENSIFKQLENFGSAVRHGITDIRIEGVGPFNEKSSFNIGRFTIALGDNASGKTTIGNRRP